MPDGVIVAVIAGGVALAVAYVNSFLAESYRRFRDGSALAASLAGELAAYEPAWPPIVHVLDSIIAAIDANERKTTFLRPIERPRDLVYEDAVKKLGLLGTDLSENVVFVYSNIGAFRIAMEIIARNEKEMSDEELKLRCIACKDAMTRAVARGADLIGDLRERANKPFAPEWPWAAWIALLNRYSL
ncbi:MAG TPA: hypothetical protein VJ673_08135 [Aromatoleum sp.]|uniref:hypothetical protein n=1 Tax=Aromatoleum sp. TaxID=2307007 RepID=UPI002B496302|nr:hypothetical protein [Aromatoleum sp.]HJV25642.1 hypothetical protein [Aromatoleum sp.]